MTLHHQLRVEYLRRGMTLELPRWRPRLVDAVAIAEHEMTGCITESLANADTLTMHQRFGTVKHAMTMCPAIETVTYWSQASASSPPSLAVTTCLGKELIREIPHGRQPMSQLPDCRAELAQQ